MEIFIPSRIRGPTCQKSFSDILEGVNSKTLRLLRTIPAGADLHCRTGRTCDSQLSAA